MPPEPPPRPGRLAIIPPVDVAAAISPRRSIATAPTVPPAAGSGWRSASRSRGGGRWGSGPSAAGQDAAPAGGEGHTQGLAIGAAVVGVGAGAAVGDQHGDHGATVAASAKACQGGAVLYSLPLAGGPAPDTATAPIARSRESQRAVRWLGRAHRRQPPRRLRRDRRPDRPGRRGPGHALQPRLRGPP